MKRILLIGVFSIALLHLFSQHLPSKTDIISKMKLVNDYWISQNSTPGNNQWARAAYFTGLMDFYKIYPKDSYLQYANRWATNNNWSLNGGSNTRNADNQTCGQIYIDLYNLAEVKQTTKISAIKTSVDNMVNSIKADDWWWIDALYMAMPVFTRMGVLYNDGSYYDKMYEIYTNTKVTRGLYNTTENLWYRDENFDPPFYTKNGQDSYWARGNGWVIAAHVRILQLLPENNKNRAEYIETFQKMAAALKDRQREDGFWNVSLDDPNEYAGPETSGTSFFTYSMAWGINNGLLDSVTYFPVVAKAWNALTTTAVQTSGFLAFVQGVGSAPSSSQPVTVNSTADFGVGAFLLAGTEIVKLASGVMPIPYNFNMTSVTATDKNHVKIKFTKPVNKSTALIKSNYNIDNEIVINNVSGSDNDSVIILNVSNLTYGSYALSISNVASSTGEIIEVGETGRFVFTGIYAVTASDFEAGTSNTPDKTVDFDLSTRWSANGSGQWIMYDLGEIMQVNSVDLAFFNGASRLTFFSIHLSKDSITFDELFNGSSSGTTLNLENFDFADQPARYVKIVGYGNSQSTWNSITEARVNRTENSSGFKNQTQSSAINFYPNPFSGNKIYFKSTQTAESTITIKDLNGKIIYTDWLNVSNTCIHLEKQLQKGVYIISISDENSTVYGKLIVN